MNNFARLVFHHYYSSRTFCTTKYKNFIIFLTLLCQPFFSNQRHLAPVIKHTITLYMQYSVKWNLSYVTSRHVFYELHKATICLVSVMISWHANHNRDKSLVKQNNTVLFFREVTTHEFSIFFSQAYSWVKQDIRHITELSCSVNVSATPLRLIVYISVSYSLLSEPKDNSMLSTYCTLT